MMNSVDILERVMKQRLKLFKIIIIKEKGKNVLINAFDSYLCTTHFLSIRAKCLQNSNVHLEWYRFYQCTRRQVQIINVPLIRYCYLV